MLVSSNFCTWLATSLAQPLLAALELPKEARKLFACPFSPEPGVPANIIGVQDLVADDVDCGSEMVRDSVSGTTTT